MIWWRGSVGGSHLSTVCGFRLCLRFSSGRRASPRGPSLPRFTAFFLYRCAWRCCCHGFYIFWRVCLLRSVLPWLGWPPADRAGVVPRPWPFSLPIWPPPALNRAHFASSFWSVSGLATLRAVGTLSLRQCLVQRGVSGCLLLVIFRALPSKLLLGFCHCSTHTFTLEVLRCAPCTSLHQVT